MKISSVLLSLILLVLSCLPCADADKDIAYDNKGKLVADRHVDHSKELHSDLCSPFCICNCCGVQILSFTPTLTFIISGIPADYITKVEITYEPQFASAFYGSIWQPPQIA